MSEDIKKEELTEEQEKLYSTLDAVMVDLQRTRTELLKTTWRNERLLDNQEAILKGQEQLIKGQTFLLDWIIKVDKIAKGIFQIPAELLNTDTADIVEQA